MSQGDKRHRVPYSPEECRQARLSKDARFDGAFFTGVFSTGIYCRPICPAVAPKEVNVAYFATAVEAANAGLRPCLRCRPDSAPNSYAWKGTQTSLERALLLIDSGCLSSVMSLSGEHVTQGGSVEELASRLGISARYLRRLFNEKLGTSPKRYAIYSQLMFAKQLLHQTQLSVTHIALASGFNSIRRFNEAFVQHLQLTPTQVRKSAYQQPSSDTKPDSLSLKLNLSYRPNFDWSASQEFYRLRAVEGMEWDLANGYGRSFVMGEACGFFELVHQPDKHSFKLTLTLARAQDISHVRQLVMKIRTMLDLDLDSATVESRLLTLPWLPSSFVSGLRIPKTWSVFEAGCRAVLGQQVSVKQGCHLLSQLVAACGETCQIAGREVRFFPTANAIANASLDELKMPGARKEALKALASYVDQHPDGDIDDWIDVKGIGPWTIAYAKMRGAGEANVLLSSDLIVKQQLSVLSTGVGKDYGRVIDEKTGEATGKRSQAWRDLSKLPVDEYAELVNKTAKQVAPWGSYLTFQLWHGA